MKWTSLDECTFLPAYSLILSLHTHTRSLLYPSFHGNQWQWNRGLKDRYVCKWDFLGSYVHWATFISLSHPSTHTSSPTRTVCLIMEEFSRDVSVNLMLFGCCPGGSLAHLQTMLHFVCFLCENMCTMCQEQRRTQTYSNMLRDRETRPSWLPSSHKAWTNLCKQHKHCRQCSQHMTF